MYATRKLRRKVSLLLEWPRDYFIEESNNQQGLIIDTTIEGDENNDLKDDGTESYDEASPGTGSFRL